jgi:hypothetical protein
MAKSSRLWKRGRGKLGVLAPLIGTWKAESDSPIGPVSCTRTFAQVLKDNYVQLSARWQFEKGAYEEIALLGVNAGGNVGFWSFTSDGKNSTGTIADATDIHPKAIAFEAQMAAGLARMAYWPDEEDGFYWAVESRNKKGWKRFTQHHYKRA